MLRKDISTSKRNLEEKLNSFETTFIQTSISYSSPEDLPKNENENKNEKEKESVLKKEDHTIEILNNENNKANSENYNSNDKNSDKKHKLQQSDIDLITQKLEFLGFNNCTPLNFFIKSNINNYINGNHFNSRCKKLIEDNFKPEAIEKINLNNLEFANMSEITKNSKNDFLNYINRCIEQYDKLETAKINENNNLIEKNTEANEYVIPPFQGIFHSYSLHKSALAKLFSGNANKENKHDEDSTGSTKLEESIIDSFSKMLKKNYENYKKGELNEHNSANHLPKLWEMSFGQIHKTPEFKEWSNEFVKNSISGNTPQVNYTDLEPSVLLVYDKIKNKFNRIKDQ